MTWRFEVWDILARQYWGELPLSDVQWNQPYKRAGELTGTLRPPVRLDADGRRDLDALVRFDRAWIFAYWNRSIPWSGQLLAAPWSPSASAMAVRAVESRGWLDEIHVGRTRTRHAWKGVDQLRITRELVALVSGREPGALVIAPDAATSGVLRDLTVEGQSFSKVGDLITSMSNRERGFDWTIGARESSRDGRPELHLVQRYPEWDQGAPPVLELLSTPSVATVLSAPELPRDASARRTVVYATGDGEAPNILVARDVDPAVQAGLAVRREAVVSHAGAGITSLATLAEHAAAERLSSAAASGTITVDVLAADPPFTTYGTGGRARLVVVDEYNDVALPGVRIVDRTMRCQRRGLDDVVTLTLDMADTVPPDGIAL